MPRGPRWSVWSGKRRVETGHAGGGSRRGNGGFLALLRPPYAHRRPAIVRVGVVWPPSVAQVEALGKVWPLERWAFGDSLVQPGKWEPLFGLGLGSRGAEYG